VEIGVHIADVSHFIRSGSHVDLEAKRRATTIYLVDRTVPMLPRPLCEIACSLNENVDRLAFSCVWTMNMDGTLAKTNTKNKGGTPGNNDDVWYGKSVIRSCARLDYNTAQNIIESKVNGSNDPSEELWPKARRPSGTHSMADVVKDVHLLHKVAKARRVLRFESGALALHGVKLAFSFQDNDATTPNLCGAYPIKDSNRLIEEYMLMANFLVAQRLITHAGGRAVLRQHPAPLEDGLADVVLAASHFGYEIDPTSSQALQESLNKLERQCNDKLAIQCITQMMTTPMKPAEYIAAGEIEEEDWRHFALNIPYYTHFTSPIRRYPDVIVHRLLQATLEGPEAVEDFPQASTEIHTIASHCNDKRMASKKAQERSDIVFLALFVKKEPIAKAMGIITSVGEKTFTVFVPSLGLCRIVFLDDHSPWFDWSVNKQDRRICLQKKTATAGAAGQQDSSSTSNNGGVVGLQLDLADWPKDKVSLTLFSKIYVSCICNPRPPIDIKFMIVSTFEPSD
jgi:DIS3-like exonuclease 2